MDVHHVNTSALSVNENRLSYCGQNCVRIPTTLGKMYGDKVTCLDLSFNKIESLKGLGVFTRLEELVLDNNSLRNLALPLMPTLKTLSLNNNQIEELEPLLDEISQQLAGLRYLSLLSNPACPHPLTHARYDYQDYHRYRLFVLHKLPALRFLDSRCVRDSEVVEARTRGHFARVHRPTPLAPLPPPRVKGKKLSVDLATLGHHKGAYGKCNYTYTGQHSEGNRFIVNSDL